MSDRRDFKTQEAERRMVAWDLGWKEGIDILIGVFFLVAVGVVIGAPAGFFVGWLVFR
jgi:hypothetical protein